MSVDSIVKMCGTGSSIPGAVFSRGGSGTVNAIPKKKNNPLGGAKDGAKTNKKPAEDKTKANTINKGKGNTSGALVGKERGVTPWKRKQDLHAQPHLKGWADKNFIAD